MSPAVLAIGPLAGCAGRRRFEAEIGLRFSGVEREEDHAVAARGNGRSTGAATGLRTYRNRPSAPASASVHLPMSVPPVEYRYHADSLSLILVSPKMQTEELIEKLGYAASPRFLRPESFGRAAEHAHLFRRAARHCSVRGVYLLRDELAEGEAASAPVLYVAEASSREEANEIHRRVWNQNVVPFLLVRTPEGVQLYSGFKYDRADDSIPAEQRGVIETSVAFSDVLSRLGDLRADAIDDGTIWRRWGEQIDPATRVDWRLLENLEHLGKWMRTGATAKLTPAVAHALVGKFVYLRYLRDRNILSDRKLEDWGIDPESVFGPASRRATVKGLQGLVEKVDEWLNGSIFPLSFTGKGAPTQEHVREVAGVFLGDDPASGQLHLDFRAYDFSFIPIETLSVIYEQFLSAEEKHRDAGAYYTPLHLVNFMLDELDGMRRLELDMTVLDPSCGSGAFLVQCYRRLVERHQGEGGKLQPAALRDLLVRSIFGVDRDEDACRVAALSLTLAMLDYLTPPDLQTTPQFKLPSLLNQNVFVGDFFDPGSTWAKACMERRYDWVVGNPPWTRLKRATPAFDTDAHANRWIEDHAKTNRVTKNDVAEAFAWKAMEHVDPDGAVGLLLPAMTLFKDSEAFRKRFFAQVDVAAVANFTNLRRDLFRKAETPAAALFSWGSRSHKSEDRETVVVFSPLVANQETNLTRPGSRREPWTITVNASEIRNVDRHAVRGGEALPWKLAMWGGPRDRHLLMSLHELPTLADLAKSYGLAISAGLELRDKSESAEEVEPAPEVVGRRKLDVNVLKNAGRVYALPAAALVEKVPARMAFARKGRSRLPLGICHPPHVIVSGARTFSTFSSDFVVVPPRQIGIAGSAKETCLLKALALYLNSEFVAYYDFFMSPQGGVREGRSTLASLKLLPAPLGELAERQLEEWAGLYDQLASTQQELWQAKGPSDLPHPTADSRPLDARIERLEGEANEAVAKVLGLTDDERVLVRDFVHVRRHLADGRVPPEAVGTPEQRELDAYARRLKRALDGYIEQSEPRRHGVTILAHGSTGTVGIELAPRARAGAHVTVAADAVARSLTEVERRVAAEHSQWLYFDRNLFLFDGPHTLIRKPLQRLWWTESQALADADQLVAEALAREEGGAE